MMSIVKNHSTVICLISILVIILVIVIYFAFINNRTTVYCNSKEKLEVLVGADFSDVEITDIQYKNSKNSIFDVYTQIFIFLKETGEWEQKEFYADCEGWYDTNPESILSSQIAELKGIGIEINSIIKHGVKFTQIRVGPSIVSCGIYWYQIDESYDGATNIVLRAGIPRKVSIDVDRLR